MIARGLTLTESDFELVLEAVLYMSRRFFAPADAMALREIEEKLDGLRRVGVTAEGAALRLDPKQNDVLTRALLAYADELNHPASDASNRARSRRLRTLATPPKPMANVMSRIRNWLTGSG